MYQEAMRGMTVLGAIFGAITGYVSRPFSLTAGRPGFFDVVTRGSMLAEGDAALVPLAERSFTYLLAGTVLGALLGLALGYALIWAAQRDEESGHPRPYRSSKAQRGARPAKAGLIRRAGRTQAKVIQFPHR